LGKDVSFGELNVEKTKTNENVEIQSGLTLGSSTEEVGS